MKIIRIHPLALSCLMIALGVLLFIWPGVTVTIAMRVLGCAILAGGVVTAASLYARRGEIRPSSGFICAAATTIAAGLMILVNPAFMISLFPIIAGILTAVNGVLELRNALGLKDAGYKNWVVPCVMSIAMIALGIFIFARPFSTVRVLMMAVGATLVYNGIANIWIATRPL